MYYEGDIKPVVKRVRPYKTLLINLPAKSFGFWVLANTKIDACHSIDNENKTFVEAETISNENRRKKRSVIEDFDDYTHIADLSYDFEDTDTLVTGNNALKSRIIDMNRDLDKIQNIFQRNKNKDRFKREDSENVFGKHKLRKSALRNRVAHRRHDRDLNPRRLLDNLLEKAKQSVDNLKNLRPNRPILNLNKVSKRHSKNSKLRSLKALKENQILDKIHRKPKHLTKISENTDDILKKLKVRKSKSEKDTLKKPSETQDKNNKRIQDVNKISGETANTVDALVRKRRNTNNEIEEISAENEIDLTGKDKAKLWNIIKKLNEELSDYSPEKIDGETDSTEGMVLKTEVSDDSAIIRVKDSNHGLIKSTMKSMLYLLEDLNKSINKVWNAINLLD